MKRKREDLLENIDQGWKNVYDTLAKLYTGATGQYPPDSDAAGGIKMFYETLGFPKQMKDNLHTLRKWRNASIHGIKLEDGTLVPWVDRPQGGPHGQPIFPEREDIKAVIARIETSWLGERRKQLAAVEAT